MYHKALGKQREKTLLPYWTQDRKQVWKPSVTSLVYVLTLLSKMIGGNNIGADAVRIIHCDFGV